MTYGRRRSAKSFNLPLTSGTRVDMQFMCRAYKAALACANQEAGKTPTLLLANWIRCVAEKNDWEESMVATVAAEWYARGWATRSSNNVDLLLLATENTVTEYQNTLNGHPRAAGILLTENGCLEELYKHVASEASEVSNPIEKLLVAGLTSDEAVKMLRVLRSHQKIQETELGFKQIVLREKPKPSKKK